MSYRESSTAVSPETGKPGVSPKSWAAAALLALPCLLGPLGAHRFHAGKIRTARAMLGVFLAGIACIGLGLLAKRFNIDMDALGASTVYLAAFLADSPFPGAVCLGLV